jgi:hypothetical protein
VVCTIHGTSPPQCRAYRCTVMRVSLRSRPIGRVTGTLALHSDDPGLRTVWEDEILPIREHDDAERRIAVILSSRGYEVA